MLGGINLIQDNQLGLYYLSSPLSLRMFGYSCLCTNTAIRSHGVGGCWCQLSHLIYPYEENVTCVRDLTRITLHKVSESLVSQPKASHMAARMKLLGRVGSPGPDQLRNSVTLTN
jgi:hypothetical protein